MENTINFKGKELKWDYEICACLNCPIYPTIKEWEKEAEKDVRKDKCYTSRCTYNKENARQVAEWVYDARFGIKNEEDDDDY